MRRLRVHFIDYQRDLVFVYGWRDVVSWPVTGQEWFGRKR